jgi:drug/metabolite transporter (DMT)-like permease
MREVRQGAFDVSGELLQTSRAIATMQKESQHRSPRLLPYLLLIVATASWGGNWVASRAVYQDVTPFALVFWRWFLAALIMLPFVAGHARRDLPAALKEWRWILFFALTGPAAFPILGYIGIRYTTAVNASLLNCSVPLFTIPIAWLVLRHTVRARQAAGLLLSLAGVLAILSAGDLTMLAFLSFNRGDLLILGGVILWAVYTVMLHRRPAIHAFSFFFFTMVIAIAVCLPFYAIELLAGDTFRVSPGTLASVGYLALFPSVIAFVCWNHAVPMVGPNVATFFYPAAPVFGSLAAVVVLGEQLGAHHFTGFVLVLGGLFLSSSGARVSISR